MAVGVELRSPGIFPTLPTWPTPCCTFAFSFPNRSPPVLWPGSAVKPAAQAAPQVQARPPQGIGGPGMGGMGGGGGGPGAKRQPVARSSLEGIHIEAPASPTLGWGGGWGPAALRWFDGVQCRLSGKTATIIASLLFFSRCEI